MKRVFVTREWKARKKAEKELEEAQWASRSGEVEVRKVPQSGADRAEPLGGASGGSGKD